MRAVARTPVIVLTWNGWANTFACLRSLQAHGDRCPVWLVDNGSDEDRSAEAAALYPGLRIVRWDDNYGWAGGYNRALRIALREGCEFAYLLNNDACVTARFLQAVLKVAEAHPRAAAVGSYLAYAATPEWLQFDGLPHPAGDRAVSDELPTRSTARLSGAGMLVRMDAMRDVGLFDERLFCYWEDSEWCARAREAEWDLLIAGGSLIFHRDAGSDVEFNALYYLYRNRYLVRARADLRFPLLRELHYVGGSLHFAADLRRAGRHEEVRAIVAGLWDGWMRKTGRRGGAAPAPISFLLSHCWPAIPSLPRRWPIPWPGRPRR